MQPLNVYLKECVVAKRKIYVTKSEKKQNRKSYCASIYLICVPVSPLNREKDKEWDGGSQIRVGTLRNTDIYGIFKEGVPSKGPEKMNQRTQEKA